MAGSRGELENKEDIMRNRGDPLAALALALLCTNALAESATSLQNQEACQSFVPASQGGPLLGNSEEAIVVRWLGTANYEITYRGQIFLIDTYYDRGPRNPSLGFTVDQVQRATAILLGHGHFDHMATIAAVAAQTGAPVYGAIPSIAQAVLDGVPQEQLNTVHDGDKIRFDGVTVSVTLARHATTEGAVIGGVGATYNATKFLPGLIPASPQQLAEEAAVLSHGTFSPDVITLGTMVYVFEFDSGFKYLFLDSAGPIIPSVVSLANRVAPVDVASVAYQATPIAEVQTAATFPIVQLFKPRLYIPNHHDEIFGLFFDNGLHPLFERIHAELPGTRWKYPLYREPICLSIRKEGED
jgi:L-ascorbate metabolism protein UlaG (beta-lactamase superfamily)